MQAHCKGGIGACPISASSRSRSKPLQQVPDEAARLLGRCFRRRTGRCGGSAGHGGAGGPRRGEAARPRSDGGAACWSRRRGSCTVAPVAGGCGLVGAWRHRADCGRLRDLHAAHLSSISGAGPGETSSCPGGAVGGPGAESWRWSRRHRPLEAGGPNAACPRCLRIAPRCLRRDPLPEGRSPCAHGPRHH